MLCVTTFTKPNNCDCRLCEWLTDYLMWNLMPLYVYKDNTPLAFKCRWTDYVLPNIPQSFYTYLGKEQDWMKKRVIMNVLLLDRLLLLLQLSDQLQHSEDCVTVALGMMKEWKKKDRREQETLTNFPVSDLTNPATVVVPGSQPQPAQL